MTEAEVRGRGRGHAIPVHRKTTQISCLDLVSYLLVIWDSKLEHLRLSWIMTEAEARGRGRGHDARMTEARGRGQEGTPGVPCPGTPSMYPPLRRPSVQLPREGPPRQGGPALASGLRPSAN